MSACCDSNAKKTMFCTYAVRVCVYAGNRVQLTQEGNGAYVCETWPVLHQRIPSNMNDLQCVLTDTCVAT